MRHSALALAAALVLSASCSDDSSQAEDTTTVPWPTCEAVPTESRYDAPPDTPAMYVKLPCDVPGGDLSMYQWCMELSEAAGGGILELLRDPEGIGEPDSVMVSCYA